MLLAKDCIMHWIVGIALVQHIKLSCTFRPQFLMVVELYNPWKFWMSWMELLNASHCIFDVCIALMECWMNDLKWIVCASLFGTIQIPMYRILHADARWNLEMNYISGIPLPSCEVIHVAWLEGVCTCLGEGGHIIHSLCVCLNSTLCHVSHWFSASLHP